MEDFKNSEFDEKKAGSDWKDWKDYKDFYEAHSPQLFGMNFPESLGEKLYYKLKYEVFDSSRFFEILDHQNENRLMLKAKQDIKNNFEIFLVDHCWTFKLRQFNEFCEKYPNIVQRVYSMLKYADIRKDIPGFGNNQSKPSLEEYIEKVKISGDVTYLEYDDMGIDDLESIYVDKKTQAVSLDGNQLNDISAVMDFLNYHPQIKAVWLDNNEFSIDEYEEILIDTCPQLEIINRKLNKNSTKWAIDYISKTKEKQEFVKYNRIHMTDKYLDLSGRNPLSADLSIFEEHYKDLRVLDMRENYELINESLFELLKYFPNISNIYVEEGDDFSILKFFIENKEKLLSICPNLKYLNEFSFETLEKNMADLNKFNEENWVRKYIWKIAHTYRLMTSEKYDEDATWYINDEFGSVINHSDSPNVALFPFIFSPSNQFKDDVITYSILWPINDIRKGQEISRDYNANITEDKQRSVRFTPWFNTPKEFFLDRFRKKVQSLSSISEEVLDTYCSSLSNLVSNVDNKEEFDKLFETTFNFDLIKTKPDHDELKQLAKTQMINSIKEDNKDYLNNMGLIKVFSDLPYVRENLKLEKVELTDQIDDADIIWLNMDFFRLQEQIKFKGIVYKNQFPFENIITMKSLLTDLIQNNLGLNRVINLSYNMETELAETIGNYYYNKNNNIDNSWILKPVNMSRSMDMIVTNNLDEIIRSVETGPKICQKYMHNPLLLKGKKFDLRFIIVLKRLVPLELYFYSKMFWVRSANKDFTTDSSSFSDYETHFTVMNYNTFGMQTIYNHQFLEYLKEMGIDWEAIYSKIKKQMMDVFTLASKDCPQMNDNYSRAIYGLDVMIDEFLEPRVLEINYSPDCTRACKFVPEFFNDIFETLFLNKPSGVEKV